MTILDGFYFGIGLITATVTGLVVVTVIVNVLAIATHKVDRDDMGGSE